MTEPTNANRIVVGIDESEPAYAALAWARSYATAIGAELDLVHAWSWPIPMVTPELSMMTVPMPSGDEMRTGAMQVIADATAAVFGTDHDGPAVVAHVGEGNVADHILRVSDQAQMIVIGSKGHGGLVSALMGSVSRQVSLHSRVPVVVGRPHSDQSGETSGASNRVVVGIDGSESSLSALQWALDTASAMGADVHAVATWEYPTIQVASMGLGNALPPADLMSQATEQSLTTWIDSVSVPDGVTLTTEVGEGSASQLLIDSAATARLLVVGRRGIGGFLGLLVGSVADKCIAHSHCPVAVIPAADA